MVQSNILDRCWLVVVAAAVFTKGEEFSRAGTTVLDHREDVLRVCECLCMHGSCSCGCELFLTVLHVR